MSLYYKYFGVKEDGTFEIIADGFSSKGIAFVSASNSATRLRCHTNPKKFIRLEIQGDDGEVVSEYTDHKWLDCNTEKDQND